MKKRQAIERTLDVLEEVLKEYPPPMSVALVRDFGPDPFIVLISCLLSLRARDTATYPVSKQLFKLVKTPQDLVNAPAHELEVLLKSIGFYRQKTAIIQDVAQQLIDRFGGQVPSGLQDLLSIHHVGIKTAALVQAEAFGIPAICVDVHVHRLANELGWVTTKTPEQTQQDLQKLLPRTRWRAVNRLLVTLGQNRCAPTSKTCFQCPLVPGVRLSLKRPLGR